jgi:hypothetical protein
VAASDHALEQGPTRLVETDVRFFRAPDADTVLDIHDRHDRLPVHISFTVD